MLALMAAQIRNVPKSGEFRLSWCLKGLWPVKYSAVSRLSRLPPCAALDSLCGLQGLRLGLVAGLSYEVHSERLEDSTMYTSAQLRMVA